MDYSLAGEIQKRIFTKEIFLFKLEHGENVLCPEKTETNFKTQ